MKSWEFPAEVRADPELAAAADRLKPLVEDVVGAAAPQVAARWAIDASPAGHRGLVLNLSDWTWPDGVEGRFAADDRATSLDTRWKVHRLWGDLLQARSHRQLAELLQEA